MYVFFWKVKCLSYKWNVGKNICRAYCIYFFKIVVNMDPQSPFDPKPDVSSFANKCLVEKLPTAIS